MEVRDVDAYGAKVLIREEEMNIIRACHDRRDWRHQERSITLMLREIDKTVIFGGIRSLPLARTSCNNWKSWILVDEDWGRKDDTMKASYKGEASVRNFASLDKANAEDFLKWNSLYFGGMDAAYNPLYVNIWWH